MDILVYVLLAAVLALGAALAVVLTRRSDTRAQSAAQSALADTVQRVEQSLRDQERTLAGLVNERLERSEKATGQVITDLRERLARIDEAQKKIGDLLGAKQPEVSALCNYKLKIFSLERLVEFLVALDNDVEITIRPARSKSARTRVINHAA